MIICQLSLLRKVRKGLNETKAENLKYTHFVKVECTLYIIILKNTSIKVEV